MKIDPEGVKEKKERKLLSIHDYKVKFGQNFKIKERKTRLNNFEDKRESFKIQINNSERLLKSFEAYEKESVPFWQSELISIKKNEKSEKEINELKTWLSNQITYYNSFS